MNKDVYQVVAVPSRYAGSWRGEGVVASSSELSELVPFQNQNQRAFIRQPFSIFHGTSRELG